MKTKLCNCGKEAGFHEPHGKCKVMEHTKGEWKVSEPDKAEQYSIYRHIGNSHSDGIIADVRTWQPKEEQQANARLIASAPDLKQVAIECLQWFKVQDGELESGRAWHKDEIKKQLKQAISKAEGK